MAAACQKPARQGRLQLDRQTLARSDRSSARLVVGSTGPTLHKRIPYQRPGWEDLRLSGKIRCVGSLRNWLAYIGAHPEFAVS